MKDWLVAREPVRSRAGLCWFPPHPALPRRAFTAAPFAGLGLDALAWRLTPPDLALKFVRHTRV